MGDYSDTFGFNQNSSAITVIKSNEYSSNGFYSAKASVPANSVGYLRFKLDNHDVSSKTITFSVNVKTTNELKLILYDQYGGSAHPTTVTIPSNSDGNFSVSITVNENSESLLFTLQSDSANYSRTFFTDNWSFTAQ